MTSKPIPPVHRSVRVEWDQDTAFRRFALEFSTWWPWRTHSVGAERVKTDRPRAARRRAHLRGTRRRTPLSMGPDPRMGSAEASHVHVSRGPGAGNGAGS